MTAYTPTPSSRGDKKANKKARAKVGGFNRKTETTIEFMSTKRYPTLAELARFVEEAQLAGVDLDARVHVSDCYYSEHAGHVVTSFKVTQALDM